MSRHLLLALSLLAIGCARQQSAPAPAAPGATPAPSAAGEVGGSSPRDAVQRFLVDVKKQDIQATSLVWGTKDGPARDSDIPRQEQEMRILIMHCYLAHDNAQIVNDAPADGGRRVLQVQLTNGGVTKQTPFTTIQGPRNRWFVETVDLAPVKDFCRNPPRR